MGKLLGFAIKNYGLLKDVKMGQTFRDRQEEPLGNLVAVIGPSGNGKSTLADAFEFISDCLEKDVEYACDANNRGGYEQLVSQGPTVISSLNSIIGRIAIPDPSPMN